jgi:signal transduction histidine kinase
MGEVLLGPWDERWFEDHCRIGRVHVHIDLPQHYMFAAMNVVREELGKVAATAATIDRAATREALDKVLDLELAIMLHTFREDLLAKAARSERLATFGQLVGSIGHELRNPLAVMETSLFLLKGRAAADETLKKHLGRIEDQVRLANGIISDLLEIIRDRPLNRERLDLGALVCRVQRSHKHILGAVADLDLLYASNETIHKFVVNAVKHVEPLDGKARLPTVEKPADPRGKFSTFEIGVIAHN